MRLETCDLSGSCRCSRRELSFRFGSFALIAWSGGQPCGGGFGFEVDDGAVVGIKNPPDGGGRCAWGAGLCQNNGFPQAKAFKLAADLVGVPDRLERAHFTAAAGAFEWIAAPDVENALAPMATVPKT